MTTISPTAYVPNRFDALIPGLAEAMAAQPVYALTDEHAASSHGQPVLVDADGNAYGAGDLVPTTGGVPGAFRRARFIVAGYVDDGRIDGAHPLVAAFLAMAAEFTV